jgi:hypothetical protein
MEEARQFLLKLKLQVSLPIRMKKHMPKVWRLNIKTAAKESVDPRMFCIEKGVLGVGWQVDYDKTPVSWKTYYKLAMAEYYDIEDRDNGWWPAVNAVKNRMSVDDLCWTRTWQGVYYLGRITSEWRYETGKEHEDADVVNVRDCDWKQVGSVESVPGKVVNSFIPPRTAQRIKSRAVTAFSQHMYNSLSQDFKYPMPAQSRDLFSLISSEDCEDVIGLYLQALGYSIIPSSCKSDTLAYEYVLKHRKTGRQAVVQAKNGNVPLDAEEYADFPGEVYLFTSRGKYLGSPPDNVHCIERRTLEDFIKNNHQVLPKRIQAWIDICNELGSGGE